MELINWWSSIGLVFDMIGVYMLFKYGLPSKVMESPGLGIGESDDEEKKRIAYNNKIAFKSHIGLFLIIIGFLLQLIGSNLPFLKSYIP